MLPLLAKGQTHLIFHVMNIFVMPACITQPLALAVRIFAHS